MINWIFKSHVYVVFILLNIFECRILANHLKFGHQLDGTTFQRLRKMSLKNCHEECVSRKKCKSYNYIRTSQTCELNSSDMVENQNYYSQSANSVYSQKCDWALNSDISDCSHCGDEEKCKKLENGSFDCLKEECTSNPPSFDGSTVLGNMRSIGSKVKYVCADGQTAIGNFYSVCNDNGTWSSPNFKCVNDSCFTPSIGPDKEMINITTDSSSVKMYFRCIGNFTTRGSPSMCNEYGNYNARFMCCDEPEEGNWVKVFNIKSNSKRGPIALWKQQDSVQHEDGNTDIDCQFRRYDIISNWNNLNISMLRVNVIKGNSIKAWAEFNGAGSDNTNWFTHERLLNTSWNDLLTITNTQMVTNISTFPSISLPGFHVQGKNFRFTIMEFYFENCVEVSGWLMIAPNDNCIHRYRQFPNIFFTPHGTKALTRSSFERADNLEIWAQIFD